MQSANSWYQQWISAHHTQKLIRDNEYWMVIGWCKKLTRGWRADQSHEHYIKLVFHAQKHHNLPCFGSSNPSVAPSLRRFQNDNMTSKSTPVEVY